MIADLISDFEIQCALLTSTLPKKKNNITDRVNWKQFLRVRFFPVKKHTSNADDKKYSHLKFIGQAAIGVSSWAGIWRHRRLNTARIARLISTATGRTGRAQVERVVVDGARIRRSRRRNCLRTRSLRQRARFSAWTRTSTVLRIVMIELCCVGFRRRRRWLHMIVTGWRPAQTKGNLVTIDLLACLFVVFFFNRTRSGSYNDIITSL